MVKKDNDALSIDEKTISRFFYYVTRCNIPAVKTILDKYPNIDLINYEYHGKTPLTAAAEAGSMMDKASRVCSVNYLKMLRFLVGNGADISATDRIGATALMYVAARYQSAHERSSTATQIAVKTPIILAMFPLLSFHSRVSLHNFCLQELSLDFLIDKTTPDFINKIDNEGNTAIVYAKRRNNLKMVNHLENLAAKQQAEIIKLDKIEERPIICIPKGGRVLNWNNSK